MKSMARVFFLLASLIIFNGALSHAQGLRLECSNVHRIQGKFFDNHIIFKVPDSKIESRTADQLIKRFDGAKLYFLQSDVDQIRTTLKGHFARLRASTPDCGPIEKAQELLVSRVRDRVEFAKTTLTSKGFKFDSATQLILDPDARQYPKSKAEQDAYHKKYLQFQLSNHMATGLSQAEASQQVIRSYERALKRVSETSTELLLSDYLDSFGRALDPHTSYFSKDNLEDFEMDMSLSLEGIGASLSQQDGFTIVENLIDGGSAKSSGLVLPQDKIVAVGQFNPDGSEAALENVVEVELRDVVRKIRGPKGTKVRLQLLRAKSDGAKERLTVTLTRDKVKLEDNAAQLSMLEREIDGKKVPIALLNLPSFYSDGRRGGRSAASDMKRLINEAKEKGAKAMVVDFSTNGGGSLEDAVRIAGLFFKLGNVVKQSNRDPDGPALTLADRDSTVDWSGPLVILTSRMSASASEIVAGTLRDYSRAVIVGGDHTFGKGSVQSVQELPPGLGAVKTTVGWFFTPGGFSTQWRGVDGDIVFPSALATDEFGEKTLDYSLNPQQIKPFRSDEAKADWLEVGKADVAQLRTRSLGRVAKNPEFQKIVNEAKKSKARGKVIKLSESFKESKERKDETEQKKAWSKEERLAEYLKRADIQESVNVAADLFATQNKVPLNKVVIPPPQPATKVAAAVAPIKKTGEGEIVVKKNIIDEGAGAIKRETTPAQTN